MSGTDPGLGGGGRRGGSSTDCPGDPFTTTLASPVPDVVATLAVGDTLYIASIDDPVRAVVAVDSAGNIAGAITREPARLRTCIEAGSSYTADVRSIAGGAVTVHVSGV